jgi:signal peptidase
MIRNCGVSTIIMAVIVIVALIACAMYSGIISVYAVAGQSMRPTITEKDLLVLTSLGIGTVNTGDIIAFRPQHGEEWQGPPIAHRIVAIDDADHITTKGDNVGFADPYDIYPADVIGRVVLVLPGAGAVMRVATSVYGYLALVLVPSLWLIANELRHLRGWRARP